MKKTFIFLISFALIIGNLYAINLEPKKEKEYEYILKELYKYNSGSIKIGIPNELKNIEIKNKINNDNISKDIKANIYKLNIKVPISQPIIKKYTLTLKKDRTCSFIIFMEEKLNPDKKTQIILNGKDINQCIQYGYKLINDLNKDFSEIYKNINMKQGR